MMLGNNVNNYDTNHDTNHDTNNTNHDIIIILLMIKIGLIRCS